MKIGIVVICLLLSTNLLAQQLAPPPKYVPASQKIPDDSILASYNTQTKITELKKAVGLVPWLRYNANYDVAHSYIRAPVKLPQ